MKEKHSGMCDDGKTFSPDTRTFSGIFDTEKERRKRQVGLIIK